MDQSIEMIKAMMDGCTARHSVLANNLANVETPGFKRKDINFRQAFENALKSSDASEFSKIKHEVKVDKDASSRPDGNTVSTQKELGQIAENNLLYQLSVTALSNKYKTIRKAISGK